jgi:hypothetical protein
MVFEIHSDRFGHPFLKKVDRRRTNQDGRGHWVEIGRADQKGIEKYVKVNQKTGHVVLLDEDGVYRMLVLTD